MTLYTVGINISKPNCFGDPPVGDQQTSIAANVIFQKVSLTGDQQTSIAATVIFQKGTLTGDYVKEGTKLRPLTSFFICGIYCWCFQDKDNLQRDEMENK